LSREKKEKKKPIFMAKKLPQGKEKRRFFEEERSGRAKTWGSSQVKGKNAKTLLGKKGWHS